MNVITGPKLEPNGSNIKSVNNEIIPRLAQMMINIETGKRHFVDGRLVENPEPTLTTDLGYCRVNMYTTSANLIILTPSETKQHRLNIIAYLINDLSTELSKLDALLGDNRFLTTSASFTYTQSQFIPMTGSLLMITRGPDLRNKRVFSYNGDVVTKTKSAFIWNILTDFDKGYKRENIDPWIKNNIDIHIDLCGLNIADFDYYKLKNKSSILKSLGIENIIRYTREYQLGCPLFRLSGTKAPEFLITQHLFCESLGMNVETHEFFNNKLFAADVWVTMENKCAGVEEFYKEYLARNYTIGKFSKCQSCGRRPFHNVFAICRDDSYAAICGACIRSSPLMIEISEAYKIYWIKNTNGLPFRLVSSDYGVPEENAQILECKQIGDDQNYARTDNVFGFISGSVNKNFIEVIREYLSDVRAAGRTPEVIELVL